MANDQVDLGDLHKALEANGHKIIKMNSGREFLKFLEKTHPDLVMISRNTIDLPASLVLRLIKRSMNVDFPIVLLVPRNPPGTPSPDGVGEFEDFIELPCIKSNLMKKIARLSAA